MRFDGEMKLLVRSELERPNRFASGNYSLGRGLNFEMDSMEERAARATAMDGRRASEISSIDAID